MDMIPIAGGVLAVIGLVMIAIAGVMLARGNKRQVKVVIPTSTAGKMPIPPAPPAPKAEAKPAEKPAEKAPAPPKPVPPKPVPPKPAPPKAEVPKPPAPPPPAPVPEPAPDPRVSEEGTRIAMIPAPTPAQSPAPPPPEEGTIVQPLYTEPKPEPPPAEEPQSTIAITPGDMEDFRTIVEQKAPKSFGILVGVSGGMEGREAKIDEEGFVIGRDQRTAQLVISDPRISKRHVWVGVREGEVWAVDVGSTNGTYLNTPGTDRITETRLKDGDVLILSEDAARFQYKA